jgi:flagellar M-ring protein FliF
VQVNTDIDFNSAKATIESYIPVEEGKNQGVLVSSQTEVETYENPNLIPNSTIVNQRNLNYSKQKTAMNYNVTKEVKQVIYAPGTVKRMSIAVAVNKILTDSEKEELKNLVLSASGVDYSRGDVISVSGLQFEGVKLDTKSREEFTKQYQQERLLDVLFTSIIPLVIVLVLGLFALMVLKSFISRMPVRKIEKHIAEEIPAKIAAEEEEIAEVAPRIEFNKKEIASQKEQNITEINEAVMASPEDAAKLLTSYIRE